MITGPSGRSYDPLPIDNTAGFPQQFPYLSGGVQYQFSLYVSVPEAALGPIDEVMTLPGEVLTAQGYLQRFLVVRMDLLGTDGSQTTQFIRKVVPSIEYATGTLALYFPTQMVARRNLNNAGSFGSTVIGGVAPV
jgi:hypothetical protein